MAEAREKTLELMRRRHAYFTRLINDIGVKTVREFYDSFREHFLMYGIYLQLSDDESCCSIYLELGDYDYENYRVVDAITGGVVEVSPEVSFKELFHSVEVNIFTGEES